MIFDTVTYEYNAAFISYLNASLSQPNKTGLNAVLHTTYNFCEDTTVIVVSVPQSQKQNPINIFNVKYKVGDFIRGTGNNLFKLVHEAMNKYSNVPKKCPVAPVSKMFFCIYLFFFSLLYVLYRISFGMLIITRLTSQKYRLF